MKKITLLIILCLSTAAYTIACGNEYEEEPLSLSPKRNYNYHTNKSPYLFEYGFDTAYLNDRQIILQSNYLQEPSFKLQSNLALIELKIGDRQKAVQILEALYAKYPQEYNIAANLGTAYEVIGNNEKAYELLQKAVTLKPNSHHGSEWIHLKILEAKIQHKDPSTILQLKQVPSLMDYALLVTEEERHRYQLLKLMLSYQLSERISFIPPQDKIVGRLLIDMSDLATLTGELDNTERYLDQALEYDPSLESIIKQRKADRNNAKRMAFVKKYWTAAVYLLGLVAVGIFLYRNRNQDFQN